METILAIVRAFVRRHERPRRGERIVCAVSGGADSTALLTALAALAPELGVGVVAAHVDHRLRGTDSRRDARAARELANLLGVPFAHRAVGEAPAPGESVEAWARGVRRAHLAAIAREHRAGAIALGHTLDDQAETVLFRALTGTSLTGLGAMRPVSADGRWLRPLLAARRVELRRALRDAGTPWVEDATNRDGTRPRSRLRHEVLPLATARIGPGIEEALGRVADEAADADALLETLAAALFEEMRPVERPGGEVHLETAACAAYHPVVRRYALRRAYEQARGDRRDLGRTHLLALAALLDRPGELHLPGGIRARAAHGRLAFTRGTFEEGGTWPETEMACPGTVSLPETGVSLTARLEARDTLRGRPAGDAREIWLDADRITGPLRLRPRRPGDRVVPFGGPGRRKVADILVDSGVPRSERGNVPILADQLGILWVVGVRRSDRAAIGPGTRRVLTIEVNKTGPCEVNEGGQDDEPSW